MERAKATKVWNFPDSSDKQELLQQIDWGQETPNPNLSINKDTKKGLTNQIPKKKRVPHKIEVRPRV